ncbi:MAG: 30S ribosomal protein S12 methylthiotransferase RimO [Bacteroidales bacterium]|jgi:ribosomal protein S12 methylthiotransferase
MLVSIITLGCSKNTVDSEKLAAGLINNGIDVVYDDISNANVVIINTCGFINDAKEESIETILNSILIKQSKEYILEKVFVFGCLFQRYQSEISSQIPEVDGWFGVNENKKIIDTILGYSKKIERCSCNNKLRELSTPNHYAYLKISEGCNKWCSFCAIPIIRGPHVSRTKEDILNEANYLYSKGVKEIILISQDLTYYGKDLYNSLELPNLIKSISEIGFDWIRLHYTHPNEITDELLNLFNEIPQLCKYLDVPLQHISTPILQSMGRKITKDETVSLVNKIKQIVPDICIRTTFIVGYPGETDEQFKELYNFVKDARFNRMGAFIYSQEEGTRSSKLEDDVLIDIKNERLEQLMQLQQQISLEINQNYIGKKLKVIVDSIEGDYYIARSEFDSPEVDNEVLIKTDKNLQIGDFVEVNIIDASYFDLFAEY